tara:strand:+ start:240 stop:611 length:372 start_codon:yes stop_codon:yes gene_type:complete
MVYANNPQTFMNSYLSALRNSIITLTLGIGIYGFSKSFKNKNSETILRLLSVLMYGYSLAICINTTLMFRTYLKKIENENQELLPQYISLKYWRVYETLGWIFCGVIVILICLGLKRFIVRMF